MQILRLSGRSMLSIGPKSRQYRVYLYRVIVEAIVKPTRSTMLPIIDIRYRITTFNDKPGEYALEIVARSQVVASSSSGS